MGFPVPPIDVSTSLASYIAVALSMIGITIFVLLQVLPTRTDPPLLTQMILALAVLGGGMVLLTALLDVFLNSNGTTAWTWVLLAFNFMMMFPVGLWFVCLVIFQDRRVTRDGWWWPFWLGLATTGSEVLMGVLFADGGANGTLPFVAAMGLGLSSVWFYWSMAAVMAALVLWAPLTPLERAGSAALVAIAGVAPWVLTFPLVGGVAGTIVMSAILLVIVGSIARRRVAPSELSFLLALSGLFAAMAAAGVGLALDGGGDLSRIGFGSVMAVGMVGEIAFLARRCYRPLAPGEPTVGETRAAAGTRPLEPAAPEALAAGR